MNKYAKIEIYDEQGDMVQEYYEPLTIENIMVALETELLEDAEVGQKAIISIVEMSEEDYNAIADSEGY